MSRSGASGDDHVYDFGLQFAVSQVVHDRGSDSGAIEDERAGEARSDLFSLVLDPFRDVGVGRPQRDAFQTDDAVDPLAVISQSSAGDELAQPAVFRQESVVVYS